MANKTTRPESAAGEIRQPEQLLGINALREKHKTPWSVFAGVCAANNWRPGKAVTEEAFLRAVSDFTGAPMDGPRRKRV